MKLSCEIVQDLLPLYEENLCSPASRAAVEEHLQECPDCRAQVESFRNFTEPEIPVEVSTEEQAVAKSFRKVRRRWQVSLIATLLVVPLLLMTINQARGAGICFTNIDEILVAWKYVHALENGDFEKVADYMHYEHLHQEIQDLIVPEPDVNGSKHRTVVLCQQDWLVTDTFYEAYMRWEEDEQQIWANLIFNRVQPLMIPENIWNEITALEPDSVQETADGELLLNGTLYVRLNTKWGTYIVEKGSDLKECTTAADFCNILEFIPSEIFKEANPDLEKQAWEHYHYIKDTYSEAASMTLEEFTNLVRTNYIEDFKTCAKQGISFNGVGYADSYYISESSRWVIRYKVQVIHDGNNYPLTISFSIREGKIRIGSMSYKEDFPEHDMVADALIMHYLD